MNRKPVANLRRIAAALCALVLMAVALPAAASDQPLPLPEPSDRTRDIIILIPLSPEPIWPRNEITFDANRSLEWTNVNADKYVLKFRNLRTGELISHTVPGICSQYCWLSEASVGLRTTYRDGDAFTWHVIAKMASGLKVKSTKAQATFNEVDQANLISPDQDGAITSSMASFRWSDSTLAKEFTLIVRDAETGTVVIKTSGERINWCLSNCGYVPTFAQRAVLEFNHIYSWQVRTTGMTGEKAKSAVFTFKWLVPYND